MDSSSLQTKILGHRHCDDEATYWSVIYENSVPDIVAAVCSLLMMHDGNQAEEKERVLKTCLFLRDLVINAPDHSCRSEFREQLYDCDIPACLEALLKSSCFAIRDQAIFTLGKIYAQDSVAALQQYALMCKESDPLLLPSLLFEINWLSDEYQYDWIEQHLLTSPSYLTRWSVLMILDEIALLPEDKEWSRYCELVESLCYDSHIQVSREAKYIKSDLELTARYYDKRKSAQGDEAEQLMQAEDEEREMLEENSPLCFNTILMAFVSEMQRGGRPDYNVGELEAFVEHYVSSM